MGEDQVFGVAFPVERWAKLIERKLAQGYELIVEQRNATLFLRGRGYEPCPYRIALMLINAGVAEPVGTHMRGVRYRLVPGASVAAFLRGEAADPDEGPEVDDEVESDIDVEADGGDDVETGAEDPDGELVAV